MLNDLRSELHVSSCPKCGEIYPDLVGDGVFYIDYDYEFIHFYISNGYIVKVSSDTARVDF